MKRSKESRDVGENRKSYEEKYKGDGYCEKEIGREGKVCCWYELWGFEKDRMNVGRFVVLIFSWYYCFIFDVV